HDYVNGNRVHLIEYHLNHRNHYFFTYEHTQDPPYQCSHSGCTKTFTRAAYLHLHERSHSGDSFLSIYSF
ncbi:unnamed protein product, partial [Rotaria sp. Silwood1]